MKNMEIIHLNWKEYEWDDEKICNDFNSEKDYGIYQIYGDHPIYGENVLLYIGKARDQRYSTRLRQHYDDLFTESHISKFRKFNLSYFNESEDVNYDKWGYYIDLVEEILINAHLPACNSQGIRRPMNNEQFKKEILILNWEERGKLLPEVSSLRYSYYFWNKKIGLDYVLKEK
jgi:hypothetical protein